MLDLCLRLISRFRRFPETCLQLLGLPRRQDLAHGDGDSRYMKLEVALFVCLPQGNAPGHRAEYLPPNIYLGNCGRRLWL